MWSPWTVEDPKTEIIVISNSQILFPNLISCINPQGGVASLYVRKTNDDMIYLLLLGNSHPVAWWPLSVAVSHETVCRQYQWWWWQVWLPYCWKHCCRLRNGQDPTLTLTVTLEVYKTAKTHSHHNIQDIMLHVINTIHNFEGKSFDYLTWVVNICKLLQ